MFNSPKSNFKPIQIIENRLYWVSNNQNPKSEPKTFYFNIDDDLVYAPLISDFGPIDIGKTVRFVLELEKLLQSPQFTTSKIYHHTSQDDFKRANAAFLMGAFQLIILHKTAEEAWEPFKHVQPSFIPFRDALEGPCDYKCTILDCLRGIEQAIKLGWFDIRKFDWKSYEHYGSMENGDLNWIIPGKILAFSGPSDTPRDAEGYKRFTPEDYTQIFKKLQVRSVVRLNPKSYNEERFRKYGINHCQLDLSGGSCPHDQAIDEFVRICRESEGAIAVHCKNGLGQTGTMIACYVMRVYKFSAASLIGWIRLCRPASILGKQQQFLIKFESLLQEKHKSLTISELQNYEADLLDEPNRNQQQPYVSKPIKPNPSQKFKGLGHELSPY